MLIDLREDVITLQNPHAIPQVTPKIVQTSQEPQTTKAAVTQKKATLPCVCVLPLSSTLINSIRECITLFYWFTGCFTYFDLY